MALSSDAGSILLTYEFATMPACNTMKGTKTQEELIVALTDKGYIKRKMAA